MQSNCQIRRRRRNLISMKPDNPMHIEPMLSLDISFVSNKKGNRFLIGMNKFSQKTWMDGSLDLSDSYEPHVMSKKVKFISRKRERKRKRGKNDQISTWNEIFSLKYKMWFVLICFIIVLYLFYIYRVAFISFSFALSIL